MVNDFVKGLEGLRKRRQGKVPGDILKPIPDETLRDIYLETMNKINDSYIEGTIAYIEEHYKELDAEINNADARINEVWKLCNNSEASIGVFKDTLDVYEKLYLEAISLFKSKSVKSQEKVSI